MEVRSHQRPVGRRHGKSSQAIPYVMTLGQFWWEIDKAPQRTTERGLSTGLCETQIEKTGE